MNKVKLIVCFALFGAILFEDTNGSLIRRKRIIGSVDYRNSRSRFFDDEGVEDYDSDVKRDARAETTYPPFPGEYDYKWDEDENTNDWEKETETEPPKVPSSTTSKYKSVSSTEAEYYKPIEEVTTETTNDEPFHKKASSWLKHQWGKTKSFFKKHYNDISERVG